MRLQLANLLSFKRQMLQLHMKHMFKKEKILCRSAKNDTERLKSRLMRGNICQSSEIYILL